MPNITSIAVNTTAAALVLASVNPAQAAVALDWSGFVTAAYTWNFEEPRGRNNNGRIFDTEANTFQVPLAELVVTGGVDDGPSFNLVLEFGDVADGTSSVGLLDDQDGIDVQQASISYGDFTFGKFATLIGAEVIESPDNMNYSRSYLFGMAIPFTHTGVLYSHQLTDDVSVAGAIVNGWDNFEDNNDEKSYMGQVAVALGEDASVSVQGIWGAEGDDNSSDKTSVIDVVASLSPADGVDLMFNFDYGMTEDRTIDSKGRPDDAEWWGAAAYADVMLSETVGVAGRAEFFSDSDGARGADLGMWSQFDHRSVDVWEVTITGHKSYGDNAMARLEARYDSASRDIFEDSDGDLAEDTQLTLAGELIFTFP